MKTGFCIVAAASLLIAGCSSERDAAARPGVLPPGTAVLTVDGKNVGSTYSVRCESIGWTTNIRTDLQSSGIDAMVSKADKLTADFVRLQNLDGFTGSYERGLQGEAAVTMAGPTYHITGAALGFNQAQPTRMKAETFTATVSC